MLSLFGAFPEHTDGNYVILLSLPKLKFDTAALSDPELVFSRFEQTGNLNSVRPTHRLHPQF